MAILASSTKHLRQKVHTRSTYTSLFYQFACRALSYHDLFAHLPKGPSDPKTSNQARLEWRERKPITPWLGSSSRARIKFSARKYAPDVRELLRGLWLQDKDPIWLLVDQLVATGQPHNMTDTCPNFPKWRHVVDAPNFLAAMRSLVGQGNLPQLRFEDEELAEGEEENDDEYNNDIQPDPVPPWLTLYLVSAKVDNRAAAQATVSFAISQVENVPRSLRVPLLLISMCAASCYRLQAQVPTVIQAFRDVLGHKQPEATDTLASRSRVIYQYNVLLTLLSRFPLVPSLATHVVPLLRNMHAIGVPIENATAAQLINTRLTARFLVNTVQEILKLQQVIPSTAVSVSFTRYFSKRRNRPEADKHIDMARGADALAHAQTYLLSFRDVAASLAYLGVIQAEPSDSKVQVQIRRTEDGDFENTGENFSSPGVYGADEIGQKVNLTSTLKSLSKRRAESPQASPAAPPIMLGVYTSMLFAVALGREVSQHTFSMMANSIRAAYGSDKVFETVVLIGLLRRRAWNQARELWSEWEMKYIQLRRAADETEAFFKRREKTFGDVAAVRKALDMTEFRSFLHQRTLWRMEVDSTALAAIVRAVAGVDADGLLQAFEVMDGYAIKSTSHEQAAPSDSIRAARFRPHNVRITSRILNCFLSHAFSRRRPDIIFRLWDSATQSYTVDVSVATLELVLRGARMAVSMEQSLVNVIPRWLLRGTLRDALPADAFRDLADEIRWMLSPECRTGTRWNGMPAWRVARRVFREEVIFANWPWLRDVAVPAQPVTGDAATSRLDALQELAMGDPQVRVASEYPHLVPRARTFREYILLLSRVQRSTEIPEVLAWMRALGVRPSRTLLSLCLALWAEVSMGSPADDLWDDQQTIGGQLRHGGEYKKLVTWLEKWLGEDEIPNDKETLASLIYVRELEQRERNRY